MATQLQSTKIINLSDQSLTEGQIALLKLKTEKILKSKILNQVQDTQMHHLYHTHNIQANVGN